MAARDQSDLGKNEETIDIPQAFQETYPVRESIDPEKEILLFGLFQAELM